ncbi:LOW QUALITY PROTEIN: uncharacterized protein LOC119444751 [Dermacentor silvarum]|uniref:LOW QUALITY PROTEIN: uncharacterized protein LOC119444751 n=1 Tax=Dermacentor silvarum TaxID=543639 RepID=UPI002101CDD1|nr:LOW QUALITY PROTEIN: uncharacterized protein LOC119444751 [Dermacentor silvarum]
MASSDVIEVFIETLHGTAFELLVSPADTVVSIKSRISRLEGIPVSQQHLIWQCQELPDDSSLHECNITDGATIKLVLGMRGGPINTRKAYLEERPTLNDVAKYLDTKGEEMSLNVPRLRAVRLVVMRDGDKVHLYTVLDSAPRSPTGLLSEDNTPRELSDEDSASESRRHRENQVTRQKLEQLQRKMRYCRLRKEGQPVFIDLATEEGTKAISAAPKALLPPLEPPKARPPAKRDDDAVDRAPPPIVPRSPLPSSNVRVFGKKKAEKALGSTVLPQLQLPTTSPGCSRITPRHWRSPSSLQREMWHHCTMRMLSPRKYLLPSYFSSSGHVTHHLPAAVARPEATGALPKRTERTAGVLHSRAGIGFQGRCRKVLLLATLGPMGPSSSRCASLPEEGTACTAEPGRYYKVGTVEGFHLYNCSSSGHVTHHLPAAVARPEATGALPKRTERTAGVLHSRAGIGFQGRCRKVLLLATLGPMGPSSSRCASLPEEGTACTAEPGRYYKTLKERLGDEGCVLLVAGAAPVGHQEQGCLPCLPPDCERQPGQDLAAVASMLEPLELDWADCDRPRTAPARYVRVSVIRRAKTTHPIVSSPCTPDKGHACNAKASSAAGSAKMAGASPASAREASATRLCPVKSIATYLDRPSGSGRWLSSPPCLPSPPRRVRSARNLPTQAGSAEGIRWALGDGGRRAAVPSPTRLRVAPLLKRVVQQELWNLEQELNNSLCAGHVWQLITGDDRKSPPPNNTMPTSNGPTGGSPERSSGSSTNASGSAGVTVAAMPAEGSSSAVSAAGATSSMSAETSASMTGTASGSNVALSVDVGTMSSADLSSGNGSELLPIQLDDDSSSTSESKTDDMPMDPLHPSPGKAKKGKRCSWCNKKTGLASTYVCRCGSTFCAAHRYAEAHACSHDYKAEGRYILQRNNPVVKAAKLPKI